MIHGCVSSESDEWRWLRRTRCGWDAFEKVASIAAGERPHLSMGMTMTLEPDADRRIDIETIWAEVGASMERFVRRRISDPHQADDVVAEVMLRIHQHLGTLDDHERLTAWVFRIARNAITDHYRRTGRRREVLDRRDSNRTRTRAPTPGSTTKTRR